MSSYSPRPPFTDSQATLPFTCAYTMLPITLRVQAALLTFTTYCIVFTLSQQKQDGAVMGREYCSTETFRATCSEGEVVVMTLARYGRMRLGRCVKVDFGYIGCYKDVLAETDERCSGRQKCEIRIPDASFDNTQPCLEDLTRFFEADFKCVPVVTATRQQCQASYAVRVPVPSGFLASVVTEQTGCGNSYRPWLIEVGLTQRINFTLYDFHTATLSRSSLNTCKEYVTIREGTDNGQVVSVCGGQQRVRHVYTSKSNKVEVLFSSLRNPSLMAFMLHYQALGCPEPDHPNNMWIKKDSEDTVVVGCATSTDQWKLTCASGKWQGRLGNCTSIAQPRTKKIEDMIRGFMTSLPNGYAITIIIGIALLISIGILFVGLIYLRRRRMNRAAAQRYQGATRDSVGAGKDIYYSKCSDGSDLDHSGALHRSHSHVPTIAGDAYDYRYRQNWIPGAEPPLYRHEDSMIPIEHIYESPVFSRRRPEVDGPQYFDIDPDDVNPDHSVYSTLPDDGPLQSYRMLHNNNNALGHLSLHSLDAR